MSMCIDSPARYLSSFLSTFPCCCYISQATAATTSTSVTLSYGILVLLDAAIMFWIFSAIVETRRTLRIRKNLVKLAMYNHFSYALIFAVLATIGFVIWDVLTHFFPTDKCLTVSVWKELVQGFNKYLLPCFSPHVHRTGVKCGCRIVSGMFSLSLFLLLSWSFGDLGPTIKGNKPAH